MWRFDASESVLLGKHPALFAENFATITTMDQKLLVTLNRKTGLVSVHELVSGKHLRDIRFGKWASAPAAIPGYNWAMTPWCHKLAIGIGTGTDSEDQLIRVLDLDQGTVQVELTSSQLGPWAHWAWHPDG